MAGIFFNTYDYNKLIVISIFMMYDMYMYDIVYIYVYAYVPLSSHLIIWKKRWCMLKYKMIKKTAHMYKWVKNK